jgi:DNA-binding LytR/AlgR family response regulator
MHPMIEKSEEKDNNEELDKFNQNLEGVCFVKVGAVFRKVDLQDVDYIVYSDRYANLSIKGKLIPLNMTMKELSKNASFNDFVQIHQSYIVNLNKITVISFVENFIEVEDVKLPIGISFKKMLQARLTFLT